MTQAESFSLSGQTGVHSASNSFLAGGGEMEERIRAFNWASTSLGPVDEWPQSLKTIVRIMLTSRQPIWIGWGPELIKLYNDPYKSIVGGKHPDALGQPAAVVWREIWDDIGPRLQTTMQNNEGTYDESLLLIMERNGYPEETYYTFSYSPVPGDGGNVEGIICANTDDTGRIIGERQVKLLSTLAAKTADARTVEERKRAEALAELDRAKTLFFSNISHEFRTPLTLMLGPIEDLLNGDSTLSPAEREVVGLMQRNTLRLLRLVNTLLDFSRMEAGRMEAVYEPVNLAALTTDLAASFRAAIEKAGMKLIVECEPLPIEVYVDRQMWEKIVLNLLSNAFKYTFEGTITVRVKPEGSGVEVSVQDTGVGIPAEELPHMFERFHRVRGTEGRSYEGMGIGLSLVYEFVKLHGGTLQVSSTPGKGSIFTIRLPVGTAHLPAQQIAAGRTLPGMVVSTATYVEEALRLLGEEDGVFDVLPDLPLSTLDGQASSARTPLETQEQAKTTRILFVDDNADMREYVRRLLGTRYSIETATDGKAALALVKKFRPDLVLADVMMPRMDGFGLLHSLKLQQETRNIPVIMLSARAGEEAEIEGIGAGADDYLVKPFSARELLARVEARLEVARLRKEAERVIQTERQYFYDLLMQAPSAVAILRGTSLVIELANPTTLKVWGRTSEQMLNKPLFDALPEIRGQGFEPLLEGVLTTGIPYVGQEQKIAIDRAGTGKLEETYLTFIYTPLRTAQGDIEGIMVFAYEVTDQVIARRKVEESEERLRALADNVPNLVWMAHADGWIYWYNSRWYDYTGTTPEQMEGWGWQSVHDPQILPAVLKKWQASIKQREPFEMTFPLRGADGIFRPFLIRVVPVYDADGELVHWFGTNTDITEQKRLEQQKDEFIGVTSHELKTPVTSLKAYTQLLERRFRQSGDGHSAELLHKMDAQINKLTGLVEDLLDVTKIENGQLRLHCSRFDYTALIREVVEEIQRAAGEHHIILELPTPVSLYADRDRIGQVLTNLLTNAIKYSPQTDRIVVRIARTDNEVITSVQDDGIGIAKEKQQHLFQRFFRVEGESQLTYPGLGLGLYIAAEFVKRNKGSMWVESEAGKGTTMSFSLPISPEVVVEETTGRGE